MTTTLPLADRAATVLSDTEREVLIADVSTAGAAIAPYWPLSAFVAVNPLGGLTDQHFDAATAAARQWFGARTHLSLAAFREEYRRGRITDADIDWAIGRAVRGTNADIDLIREDLLHGPGADPVEARLQPASAAVLDGLLSTWCASFVDEAHAAWAMPNRDQGFYRAWRALAGGDRRLADLVGGDVRQRCAELPDDPVEMLAVALASRGVADDQRVDAVRTWLLRTPGWAGFARWCDEWAPSDRGGVRLHQVDLAAVRAAMDHLALEHLDLSAPAGPQPMATEYDRDAIWLAAHEKNFRDRLLARLAPSTARPAVAEGVATRPDAQLVFCIDVRSEGFRRQLEAIGRYETFGFAGFFGVPVRFRQLGSEVAEARCPVLVSPRHEVGEVALDNANVHLAARSTAAGLHDAVHAAKGALGSSFVLAESAGWFTGPRAAWQTWAPRSAPSGDRRQPWWRRAVSTRTTPTVAAESAAASGAGLSIEERTTLAEAIVTTIGLREFAPMVVLCGHGSSTTNNPHASSLDCGACGGAPGGASARIAAAILNDAAVRRALGDRGIDIPDDTWFVAAEHDTTADVVTILDADLVPDWLAPQLSGLRRDLERAGQINAADRARRLPGNASRVRDRGHDWAQVRPEWGLAGNAAFIIGPRSMTAPHELEGRAFLHSYVAEHDPAGAVLESIMTAPLVVAQWISSQYYFSTVDPAVFGAGDKMLHNPVGGIGVVVGESGDLAVGLPMQSVMFGEQRAHDPLRLLAVVQAPLEHIDDIISRHSGLRQLVDGEWIHIAARASHDAPWSIRAQDGTWEPWHLASSMMTEQRLALATTTLALPLTR